MANVIVGVISAVDATSVGLVTVIYGALGESLFPAIRNVLIISMILFGLSMMMGWIEYPVKEFAKHATKITLVLGLAFNWVYFDLFFYQLFTTAPGAIGTIMLDAIGGGGADSIAAELGELLSQGIVASGAAFSSDGFFMPYVLGALIFIAITLICGFALALLILAKIATAVILALGPIFIIFLLFDMTKQMFASWLQQVFNFAFITILTYVVMAFFTRLIENSLNAIPVGGNPEIGDITPLVIIGFVGCFILAQIPGIASGLAGGVQVGTMGTFSAASRQLQRFKGYSGKMPSLRLPSRTQQIKRM
jgi:type IV secretion system protein VirB6